MSGDPRLPALDPSAEVIDLLAALLRAARHDPEFERWPELKIGHADELDGIREAVAASEDMHQIWTAASAGPAAIGAIERIARRFTGTPSLVLIAAAARGLDDLYGDYLRGPWLEDRLGKGPIRADDLIVTPGTEHLRVLFGSDRSFSVPQTRAAERPDQTRRCRLYEPPAAAPPIRLAADLETHLDQVLSDAKLLATAHPTASTEELEFSFPVRARDEPGHIDAVVSALSQLGANLVAIPACSPKTTNLAANAATLAASGPGLVVIANGPRFFRNAETGAVDDAPVAIFASPLDRVQDPTHIARCSPPQLCVYDIETNSVAAV